jgi:hypothetical protein
LAPVVFWSEVNVPAMNTRWPTTSMSQISPLGIRGVLVRGVLGTRPVWPGAGCAAPAGGAATNPRARVARTIAIAAATARERMLRRLALGTWSPGGRASLLVVHRMLRRPDHTGTMQAT